MTCHSYPRLNEKDSNCNCNCDHSNCDTNDVEENEDYCNNACHESCKYLRFIDGDKTVVAMLLKEALLLNDKIFIKYLNLLNTDDKYFQKPYRLTLTQYYTD